MNREDYEGRLYFAILDDEIKGCFTSCKPAIACIDEAWQALTVQARESVQHSGVISGFNKEDLNVYDFFTDIEYVIKGFDFEF